jgi:hypothetical protein
MAHKLRCPNAAAHSRSDRSRSRHDISMPEVCNRLQKANAGDGRQYRCSRQFAERLTDSLGDERFRDPDHSNCIQNLKYTQPGIVRKKNGGFQTPATISRRGLSCYSRFVGLIFKTSKCFQFDTSYCTGFILSQDMSARDGAAGEFE